MFASVIVDVPAYAIDRPFDYIVPKKWQSVIQRGSRVKVPFGPRAILGYVVALSDETAVEASKLKSITTLIDVEPVLTEELLQLADELAYETICLKIEALQVMLPSAMRARYDKQLVIRKEEDIPSILQSVVRNRLVVPLKEIDELHYPLIRTLIRQQVVEIETVMKQQHAKKKTRMIHIPSLAILLEKVSEIQPNATRQQQLMEWLFEHPNERIASTTLQKEADITPNVLKNFIEKGILTETFEETYRILDDSTLTVDRVETLTEGQRNALHKIVQAIDEPKNTTFLLRGVTGSGKTEVYLRAIERVLERGEEAIVLVPEISLTPQMTARFKARFGKRVAVMHSGLSPGEKYDEWRKVKRGEVDVVVGARSAVFVPFTKIGLIILDEEHESTYKQEDAPRYHAREVAKWRATYHQCPVLLGSATPALESYARAAKGVYTLLEMDERPKTSTLPTVEVVDMREELRFGNRSMFSQTLKEAIQRRIERDEQVILFLNRRGFSSFVLCRDCGLVLGCPNCDISLTYHRATNEMKCHYCDYHVSPPSNCPQCQSEHIRFFGTGTQQVEQALYEEIENARVVRMDVDTTSRKGAHEKLLKQFEEQKGNILLGTQMVAKGLDFPNVTLVGVIAADTTLHLADFRAAERTFQLLTQVSGRAGRAELPGEVVIQTYSPEHYAIQLAKRQQYVPFYETEMKMRKWSNYPPFYFIVLIQLSHPNAAVVAKYAHRVARYLRDAFESSTIVLGPAPAVINRIKNRYRYQCLIKYKKEPRLYEVLHQLMHMYRTAWQKEDVRMTINIEPSSIL